MDPVTEREGYGAQFDEAVRREMVALLPRLRRFACGLTGSVDEGDDLVQQTCERAIRNIARWRAGTRLDSWMYRIAQNLHLNRIRDGRHRERLTVDGDMGGVADPTGERVAEARITLDLVRRKLAELPADQSTAILLVCVEGLSYREAAEVMEVPIGTVMSRLGRARTALRALIEDEPRASGNGHLEIVK